MKSALGLDVAWIEIDTRQTADGKVIVFHDSRLDRITSAGGRVQDYSLSKDGPLRYLDAEETIPTLSDFLEEFAASRRSTKLMIDIKDPRTEEAHVELIREYRLEESVWVIAWDPTILVRTYQLAPELSLGFSHIPLNRLTSLSKLLAGAVGDGAPIRWTGRILAKLGLDHAAQDVTVYYEQYNRGLYREEEIPSKFPIHLLTALPDGHLGDILRKTHGGVGMPTMMLDPSYIQEAHEQGLKVFVYSIDSLPSARRAMHHHQADIIFTNKSEMFIESNE